MVNWNTKPKIAVAAGLLGLIAGVGIGGQPDEAEAAKPETEARTLTQSIQAKADARVEAATTQADARVAEATTKAEQASQTAMSTAVADAVAAEKAKRQKLIDAAVAKAVKKTKADAPKPRTLVDAEPTSTDPMFDTCGDANAAGYGNYQQGKDAEYDWYQDRDGDGFVCE